MSATLHPVEALRRRLGALGDRLVAFHRLPRLRSRPAAAPPRPSPGRRHGPWRVAVAEGSMVPAIEPGDWLLVDPTVRAWPRRGAVVVFREPGSDLLVIKRVLGRPHDVVPTELGSLRLAAGEAWLVGDAPDSHDSRHYGPVPVDRLVGRAWFRYGPLRRVGPLATGRFRP